MDILATERFLERAKKEPNRVHERVQTLVEAPSSDGAPRAAPLPDDRVLGWSQGARELKLWCVLEASEARRPAPEPALASMSKADLRDLGLDDVDIAKVQQVHSVAELDALRLPEAIAQRLRFVILQRATGLCASEDELRYRAIDVAHLDRYLHGDITQLLLNLDPSQRQIVALDGSGPVIVRGVAGSGKTAVALHRIYGRLKQRSLFGAPRILFLTYSRALAAVAGELLVSMGLRANDVEVSTVHKWCSSLAGTGGRVLSSRDRRQLIRQACEAVRATAEGSVRSSALWSYPLAFWEDELHRIKGSVLENAEDYARLYRYGAGRALDQRLRVIVWQVYAEYLGLQKKHGLDDFDDVVRLAYERLRTMGSTAPRFDHVFVDEAQDLTVMALRVAAALCKPEGTLQVSYDPAQSIYERGFRWKSCGITVHGSRSFELRKNYRNTAEILAAAKPLLAGMKDTLDTGEAKAAEEVIEPEQVQRHGPAPRFVAVETGDEYRAIATDISRLIREEGVPPQNIAVLCYPNAVRDRMSEELERSGILFQQKDADTVIRVGDPSVKVLPIKSAKGLEFPVVYLLATGAHFAPPVDGEKERAAWLEQMGRCFYMAMTRAMSRLTVVFARHDPARFLPPGACEPTRARRY